MSDSIRFPNIGKKVCRFAKPWKRQAKGSGKGVSPIIWQRGQQRGQRGQSDNLIKIDKFCGLMFSGLIGKGVADAF